MKYILIENESGQPWFEGTLEHWKDTFFSNAEESVMKEFAENNNSTLYREVK